VSGVELDPNGQPVKQEDLRLFAEARSWRRCGKFDRGAALIASRHYSRRNPDSPQFMPPGQTVCLTARHAVFGWWRPAPAHFSSARNGLNGWTCTIFRNEGSARSSDLILAAELQLVEHAPDCGPDGMITYVWDRRVRSVNPGYCFKMAGWEVTGRSADNQKTLLQKPFELAGSAP
jgi:hypothetical protein